MRCRADLCEAHVISAGNVLSPAACAITGSLDNVFSVFAVLVRSDVNAMDGVDESATTVCAIRTELEVVSSIFISDR